MNGFPIATALRESLSKKYTLRTFGADLTAAVIVSLVALPLAMALAIAVGLPPEHGIYTAIIAGIITPLLGGSAMQVSGPTAAFVVILAPIITEFGLRGMLIAQIMAGIMLLLLAWGRLGRFISFVPYPVTTGFTAGIAVVIATLSINDLFGLGIRNLEGSYIDKVRLLWRFLPEFNWPDMAIGLVSLTIMFTGKHITRRIPSAILGVLAGTVLAIVFQHMDLAVTTIDSRFRFEEGEEAWHATASFLPQFHWFGGDGMFAWPRFIELKLLFLPAVVIAALAALESLLSATVADGLSRKRHDPNAELTAIGVSNIASALTLGIPATGAIARTTTNIKSGACTPIASSMHGALILLYVLLFPVWIAKLPMASLSALLMLTAYNMSHYKQCYRILKIAPRQDAIVLLTCFGLTVFIDMVAGVTVGILLAALLFIQRISTMTEMTIEDGDSASTVKLPSNVAVYTISGPLFFGTVERTLDRTAFLRNRIDTLILNMQQVPLIDMTGLVALKNLLTSDGLAGKRVIVCAKRDVLSQIMHKMTGESHVRLYTAATVDDALALIAKAA